MYNGAVASVDGIGSGDDHTAHTGIKGLEGVLYLRHHASGDSAVSDIPLIYIAREERDDTVVIIRIGEHTGFFKREDEGDIIVGGKALGGLPSHGVGIGIKDVSLAVVGERCDDRGDTCFKELVESFAIGAVNISYEAEVDELLLRAFSIGKG